MKMGRFARKVATSVLLGAVVLRLMAGILVPGASAFPLPRADMLLLYGKDTGICPLPEGSGTQASGTVPATSSPPQVTVPATTVPTVPETQPLVPLAPAKLTFTRDDLQYTSLIYGPSCEKRPDLAYLLGWELDLSLAGSEPTVLIVHTHATECYTKSPGEDYSWFGSYRTEDTNYNMVSIGEALARQLEAAGIHVIHDKTLHDRDSYDDAYTNSKAAIRAYLKEYPSIQLVLDLHRDAAQNADGSQYAPTVDVHGDESGMLMMVMGTDSLGPHYYWQQNLALALKMQVMLERLAPNITRDTQLRTPKFNQHLHNGSLLVEVGTAGNTHDQALKATEVLGNAIIALMNGAN